MFNSYKHRSLGLSGIAMKDVTESMRDVRSFNKYLLFYGPGEMKSGLKGIRSDAPPRAIDDFLQWYRENNRFSNGRMRSKENVTRNLVFETGEYHL